MNARNGPFDRRVIFTTIIIVNRRMRAIISSSTVFDCIYQDSVMEDVKCIMGAFL